MQGVSNPTAQRLGQAQQGYKQGDQVTAAQDTLSRIQANRPQSYTSKYQPMLDDIMNKIQNPGEFKYEFNGDNLFKNYADLFTQKGKQASMDTMGQAAALTGGYGNSYAQAAGNQAYQQYLLSLYDRGMDLRDRAYQGYRDNLGDLKDQYGMLQGADETDYGRYRDTVADWTNEEQQAYNRMQDAQNFDYTQYQNDLNYWTGLAQVENAAWTTEQQRQEAIRQYNQNYAMDTILRIAANGQMPSADLLRAAGLSEADARALMAQIQPSGGGGGGNGGGKDKGPYVGSLAGAGASLLGDYTKAKTLATAKAGAQGLQNAWNSLFSGNQQPPTAINMSNYIDTLKNLGFTENILNKETPKTTHVQNATVEDVDFEEEKKKKGK
jgi:hypothetical protein